MISKSVSRVVGPLPLNGHENGILNGGDPNHLYTHPGMFLQVGGCRCTRTNPKTINLWSLYLEQMSKKTLVGST